MRRVWTTVPVLIGTLVLLAAACSGSNGNGAEPTASATTAVGGPTATASSTTDQDSSTGSSGPTGGGSTQDVLVFFSNGDPDECAAVASHVRTMPGDDDPIRSAFDELVAGPTPQDGDASSFFSSQSTDTVRSATASGGLLVVDFDDFRALLTPKGANTSCGSASLLAELNATAFQFNEVDTVRYELEGSCDEFGEWLQRDCIVVDRAAWAVSLTRSLPGEPFDGPQAGVTFGVVGVAADDMLNVRALPGAGQAIIAELEPLATGVELTGKARLLSDPRAVWYEIDAAGVIGWVHSRFVAPLAGTFDITSEVVSQAGGTPTGATIEEIGARVVEVRSQSDDPPPTSTVVDGPRTGDPSEITYDLIGFLDDSVLGERLHLFIGPANGGGQLQLKQVEVTYICARGGGSGTGLCP